MAVVSENNTCTQNLYTIPFMYNHFYLQVKLKVIPHESIYLNTLFQFSVLTCLVILILQTALIDEKTKRLPVPVYLLAPYNHPPKISAHGRVDDWGVFQKTPVFDYIH